MATAKMTSTPSVNSGRESMITKVLAFFLKNRSMIINVAIAALVVIGGYVAYKWYQSSQNAQAIEQAGGAIRYFDVGEYRKALDGVGKEAGLIKIANEYGNTATGNLAKYYVAVSLEKLNDRKKALSYYQDFDKSDNFVSASAYAAEAGIVEDFNRDFAKAASLYEKAASIYPDKSFSPNYLVKAGRNYEMAKDLASARRMYDQLKTRYKDTLLGANADMYFARIEAQTKK